MLPYFITQIALLVEHQISSLKAIGLRLDFGGNILCARKCPPPLFQVEKWPGTCKVSAGAGYDSQEWLG